MVRKDLGNIWEALFVPQKKGDDADKQHNKLLEELY